MKKLLGLSLVAVFCSMVFVGEAKAVKQNEPPGNRLKAVQSEAKDVVCNPETLEKMKAEKEALVLKKKDCKDKEERRAMNRDMRALSKQIRHCSKTLKKNIKK